MKKIMFILMVLLMSFSVLAVCEKFTLSVGNPGTTTVHSSTGLKTSYNVFTEEYNGETTESVSGFDIENIEGYKITVYGDFKIDYTDWNFKYIFKGVSQDIWASTHTESSFDFDLYRCDKNDLDPVTVTTVKGNLPGGFVSTGFTENSPYTGSPAFENGGEVEASSSEPFIAENTGDSVLEVLLIRAIGYPRYEFYKVEVEVYDVNSGAILYENTFIDAYHNVNGPNTGEERVTHTLRSGLFDPDGDENYAFRFNILNHPGGSPFSTVQCDGVNSDKNCNIDKDGRANSVSLTLPDGFFDAPITTPTTSITDEVTTNGSSGGSTSGDGSGSTPTSNTNGTIESTDGGSGTTPTSNTNGTILIPTSEGEGTDVEPKEDLELVDLSEPNIDIVDDLLLVTDPTSDTTEVIETSDSGEELPPEAPDLIIEEEVYSEVVEEESNGDGGGNFLDEFQIWTENNLGEVLDALPGQDRKSQFYVFLGIIVLLVILILRR